MRNWFESNMSKSHACDFYIPRGAGRSPNPLAVASALRSQEDFMTRAVSELFEHWNKIPDTCRICLDSLDTSSFTLEPCKHVFHKTCIEQLEFAVCPLCRGEFKNIPVKGVYEYSSTDYGSSDLAFSKIQCLITQFENWCEENATIAMRRASKIWYYMKIVMY